MESTTKLGFEKTKMECFKVWAKTLTLIPKTVDPKPYIHLNAADQAGEFLHRLADQASYPIPLNPIPRSHLNAADQAGQLLHRLAIQARCLGTGFALWRADIVRQGRDGHH